MASSSRAETEAEAKAEAEGAPGRPLRPERSTRFDSRPNIVDANVTNVTNIYLYIFILLISMSIKLCLSKGSEEASDQ